MLDPDTAARELGDSSRVAAAWLRQYIEQLRDPAASVAPWQKFVEEENAKREEGTDETTTDIVCGLVWNLADLHRQLDNREAMLRVVDRMVDLNIEESQPIAVELIEWLMEHQIWDLLMSFSTKHQPSFEQSKRLLYYAGV